MPRERRIFVNNACYHIITRGNQKQNVFLDKMDYQKYLEKLVKCKVRFGFKLYSFCLMPNHVHLLIKPLDPLDLSKIMGLLNLGYTRYFNCKYDKVGHLWQDRYKSKIIEDYSYLYECIQYIETNPLRASLINDLNTYQWSSAVSRGKRISGLIDRLDL